MKLKSNVDLGKAFDVLKAGVAGANNAVVTKEGSTSSTEYAAAFGALLGTCEAVISYVEEKGGEPEDSADDIPAELFRQ